MAKLKPPFALMDYQPVHHNCGKLVKCDSCHNFEKMVREGGKRLFQFAVRMLISMRYFPTPGRIYEFLVRNQKKRKVAGFNLNMREIAWRNEIFSAHNWKYQPEKRGMRYPWILDRGVIDSSGIIRE